MPDNEEWGQAFAAQLEENTRLRPMSCRRNASSDEGKE
jgi:hypothetical protein